MRNGNAIIIAFESDDTNLLQLTSTLLTLSKETRNRVAIFPIRIGKVETIIDKLTKNNDYNQNNNATSSSWFRTEKEDYDSMKIIQTTLDNVFEDSYNPSSTLSMNVPVLKIDTPSSGCDIIHGGYHVLSQTQTVIKFSDARDDNTDINMNDKNQHAAICSNEEWKSVISHLGFSEIEHNNVRIIGSKQQKQQQ